MRARFELGGRESHQYPVVVLEPDTHEERMLLVCWMRFDANSFSVSVARLENGAVASVHVEASQAS